MCKKLAHTRLLSVEFRSWSQFLAVSLQVMRVINLALGYHYLPPGLQLPTQLLMRGLLPISLLGEQWHGGCAQFSKTVTQQHRGCDFNLGPTAPESSMLTTWLLSHALHTTIGKSEKQSCTIQKRTDKCWTDSITFNNRMNCKFKI